MACVTHRIPFPCAVYTRKRTAEPYVSSLKSMSTNKNVTHAAQVFSHMCTRTLEKELPHSLSVNDIRASSHTTWTPRALRQPVLVLVAGDVAQPVGADWNEARQKKCPAVRFLYAGSEFDRNRDARYCPESELDTGYVKIMFYSSITVFAHDTTDCVWRPRDTAPLESSMVLLPRILPDAQLAWLSKLFESAVHKSANDSTWLVERDGSVDVYSERTLQPRRAHRGQRRPDEGDHPSLQVNEPT